MEELKKIRRYSRSARRRFRTSRHVGYRRNTGQNGVNQAKEFTEAVGCDGVMLTKLDSTAKGGVILAIRGEMGVVAGAIHRYWGRDRGFGSVQRARVC